MEIQSNVTGPVFYGVVCVQEPKTSKHDVATYRAALVELTGKWAETKKVPKKLNDPRIRDMKVIDYTIRIYTERLTMRVGELQARADEMNAIVGN